MVDIPYLRRKGISSAAYKKIFTADRAKYPPQIKRLIKNATARISDGREMNFRDYRTYAAIDLAHDESYSSTTGTLVQNLIASGALTERKSPQEVTQLLENWGLKQSDLFIEIDMGDGNTGLLPNPPLFQKTVVDLVAAYHKIRAAKIYNERDKSPLFSFTPLKMTARNEVICDAVTDIVQTVSTWYGYPAKLREAIRQMLRYGICIGFPMEEWHYDKQIVGGKLFTEKEGIRHILPHPTQFSYDLFHSLNTLNSDSGCEHAEHWEVVRYGDIFSDKMYWNRGEIAYGRNWMDSKHSGNYFSEVYPCQMRMPVLKEGYETREDRAAWYSSGDRDKGVFKTNYYAKINPLKCGLGDYNHDVWHRFIFAGDDTVIWAEPCAYNPMWFMGYDYDGQSARTPSFSLECLPWQHQLGNILTNINCLAKQNLINLIMYDKNLVNKTEVEKLQKMGDGKYGMNFLSYDSLANRVQGLPGVEKAFTNVQFQYRDINQMIAALSTTLNIMERVLQISAQEAGAAAQHYQSAQEISALGSATGNRLAFTASGVDEGIEAWKKQIYDGALAYMDTDFIAQVSAEIDDVEAIIAELGFKVKNRRRGKIVVAGKKTSLRLEGFARSNVGPQMENNMQVASAIFQTIGVVGGNEQLFARVGADNFLKMAETAAKLAGAPRDFKLVVDKRDSNDEQAAQILKQLTPVLQQLEQKILQEVEQKVAAPAAAASAEQDKQLQQQAQIIEQLQGIYKIAAAQQEKVNTQTAEAQQKMQIQQAEFDSDQRRKEEEHQQAMRIREEEAANKIQVKQAEAAASAELKRKAAAKSGE